MVEQSTHTQHTHTRSICDSLSSRCFLAVLRAKSADCCPFRSSKIVDMKLSPLSSCLRPLSLPSPRILAILSAFCLAQATVGGLVSCQADEFVRQLVSRLLRFPSFTCPLSSPSSHPCLTTPVAAADCDCDGDCKEAAHSVLMLCGKC